VNEAQELKLVEQQIALRNAFKVWVGHPDYPTLRAARLNGDVLWLESQGHFWLGVDLVWELDVPIPIVRNGEFVKMGNGIDHTRQSIFMRVFNDLAEFDRRMRSPDDPAMFGLRHGCDLNEVHEYYDKV
jgi:hypothetical protein